MVGVYERARDEAGYNGITGADKNNRNLRSCRLGHRCRRRVRGDYRHIETDKIGSHCSKLVVLTPSPPVIYRDALSFDVTGFRKPKEEASHVRCVSIRRSGV